MTKTHPVNGLQIGPQDQDLTAAIPNRAIKPSSLGVRMVEIKALRTDGSIVVGQRKIPMLPQFDTAFSAFSRGTLLQTETGVVAVEDLCPGDRVMTAEGKASQITWIGSATFSGTDQNQPLSLTRIMAGSFGVTRPDSFLSLGPSARLLQTPPHLRGDVASKSMMTPANTFVEGVNVIDVTPPSPIRLFHLGLQQHTAVIASGLEIESFHPGPHPLRALSHTLREVYMSLFPHLSQINDFGPMRYARAADSLDQNAA
ncbi:Hint domain-containing protein [uncultured Roseobacter sp.]|uniref:Hint domain-containing protein n=1 Tax=uncultured Roseobacter sp. TaxID=114847 RepID=UPI00262E8F6B|nr:Hint domain-containing protein [uncultured Roseobacter sp.]